MKRNLLIIIFIFAAITIFAQKNKVPKIAFDDSEKIKPTANKERAIAPDFNATFTDNSTFNNKPLS